MVTLQVWTVMFPGRVVVSTCRENGEVNKRFGNLICGAY
jgi:hypothetical protein